MTPMRRPHFVVGAAVVLALAACGPKPKRPRARADLRDAESKVVARVYIGENAEGVLFDVFAQGLPAGTHAVHIHESAQCDPPGFATASSHAPELGKKLSLVPNWDIGRLTVGPDGKGTAQFLAPRIKVSGIGPTALLREGGTALVVHPEAGDNAESSGASARACGPIVKL